MATRRNGVSKTKKNLLRVPYVFLVWAMAHAHATKKQSASPTNLQVASLIIMQENTFLPLIGQIDATVKIGNR